MLEGIFKSKEKKLEDMTEKDIETAHHSKIHALALMYDPKNKAKIDSYYNLLKEFGDSPSIRAIFINRYIIPYMRKNKNETKN